MLHNPYQGREVSIQSNPKIVYNSTRNRNSSMDSIIPIIVTKDGDWRGSADSTIQPTPFAK